MSLPREMISSTDCAKAGDTSEAAAHKASAPKSTLNVPHFDSVLICSSHCYVPRPAIRSGGPDVTSRVPGKAVATLVVPPFAKRDEALPPAPQKVCYYNAIALSTRDGTGITAYRKNLRSVADHVARAG
jgi:hypothetical protein